MEITWYGLSCFRMTERGLATIVTDPYGKKIGLPALKLKADVVTISHQAPGHNYAAAVIGKSHTLDGPGEYEIGNVFITGVATFDSDNNRNVIYVYNFNNVTVAHLGDLAKVPTQSQLEALGEVNVLLVPVGGGSGLNAAQAAELVSMIEPNIIIPMHYQIPKLKIGLDDADRFLKEMGVTELDEETSLKITASKLAEETQVSILKPKS